jgi:hypothetical protein
MLLILFSITIVVDTTGVEGDSLQKAIDSTLSFPGIDTVQVMPGLYSVIINGDTGLIMRDSVVLLAKTIHACTLDRKSEYGHVIYCNFGDSSSHSSVINGFIITNGYAWSGSGIYLVKSSPIIRNCVLYSTEYVDKGQIFGNYSSPILESDSIVNRQIYSTGRGAYFINSSPHIINCKISNHTALGERGVGIYFRNCDVTIINSIISDNYALVSFGYYCRGGVGIYLENCNATLIDDIIEGNDQEYDPRSGYEPGGGVWINGGSAEIYNNIIIDNHSYYKADGIYIEDCSTTIKDNEIKNNAGNGGWIKDANVVFKDNTIKDNSIEFTNTLLEIKNNTFDTSDIKIDYSLIIGKYASKPSSFIIENNSSLNIKNSGIYDNGNNSDSDGFMLIKANAESINIHNSNIYFNTYQQDKEIINNSSIPVVATNNFWWYKDSSTIASLLKGDVNFIPFEIGPVSDAPSEPVEIYSVLNYSSDYSSIVDSIGKDPDTLYLEITGHDNNNEYQEAAVAILKSMIYPTGIAVALLETDKSTGIYRGKAIVKTSNPPDSIRMDDIYQIIRVHPDADTIRVYANMDTTEMFKVYYRCHSGINEDKPQSDKTFFISAKPNLLSKNTLIQYSLKKRSNVSIKVYSVIGQKIVTIFEGIKESGIHEIKWLGVDNKGNRLPKGIYFLELETSYNKAIEKIVIVK